MTHQMVTGNRYDGHRGMTEQMVTGNRHDGHHGMTVIFTPTYAILTQW
jgi:hypothetical protein